jgi:hypothetical protein
MAFFMLPPQLLFGVVILLLHLTFSFHKARRKILQLLFHDCIDQHYITPSSRQKNTLLPPIAPLHLCQRSHRLLQYEQVEAEHPKHLPETAAAS